APAECRARNHDEGEPLPASGSPLRIHRTDLATAGARNPHRTGRVREIVPGDGSGVGVGLFDRYSRLEPAKDPDEIQTPREGVYVVWEGQPGLYIRRHAGIGWEKQLEAGGHDARARNGPALELDCLPNDTRISAEAPPP